MLHTSVCVCRPAGRFLQVYVPACVCCTGCAGAMGWGKTLYVCVCTPLPPRAALPSARIRTCEGVYMCMCVSVCVCASVCARARASQQPPQAGQHMCVCAPPRACV